MDPLENLRTTHAHEEKLRDESLAIIQANAELFEQLQLVERAMNVVFGYSHDHPHQTDDELTLQMLGIRLFNAAASSVKLALGGYYQTAFAMTRDILEVSFLLDYFRTSPEKIAAWKLATPKQRRDGFGPVKVRDVLDARDGLKEKKREVAYKLLSEHASHATYRGFMLTAPKGMGEIGPFVDKTRLEAWLQEMVLRFCPGAIVYGSQFRDVEGPLRQISSDYLETLRQWQAKNFPSGRK